MRAAPAELVAEEVVAAWVEEHTAAAEVEEAFDLSTSAEDSLDTAVALAVVEEYLLVEVVLRPVRRLGLGLWGPRGSSGSGLEIWRRIVEVLV